MTNKTPSSRDSSPNTIYLEDFISFQADVKDLDIFPEELTDNNSDCVFSPHEQEQGQSDCASSHCESIGSQDSISGSEPSSPFTHIKCNFPIPRNSSSPSSFNSFNKRNSLCDHHHSILCTVCSSSRPTLHSHAQLLHQPPDVVAQEADNPVQHSPTHNPSSPVGSSTTDIRSPSVECATSSTTEKSPTAERKSPTAQSPEMVTTIAKDHNNCSHYLLPKCYNCGNCLCCILLYNKGSHSDIKHSCSGYSPSLFTPLTIDIPEIAPLNTKLKSPSSNRSLNTPVCQFSPVTPQPEPLFISGHTTPSKDIGNSHTRISIPCLLEIEVHPTLDFITKYHQQDGRIDSRRCWRMPKCRRRRRRRSLLWKQSSRR